jgi:hypothetical protein
MLSKILNIMQKLVLISTTITFLFCLFKFLEMRYLECELKPLKFFVRDAVIVFCSAAMTSYVFFYLDGSITDFFDVITDNKTATNIGLAPIFTDAPGF